MLNLFYELANRVGLIIMISFVFSRSSVFKKILLKKRELSLKEQIVMGLFFGGLGIIGTYTGISYSGAIVNTRVIGVVVGGLLGGPVVGVLAGASAGIHRFLIDPVGMTAISCAISTTCEGILAGMLSEKFSRSNNQVLFAWQVGITAEIMQMLIIFIIVRPLSYTSNLIGIIGVPMILMNAIGIAIFISIVGSIKKLQNSEAAFRAQQTLLIADQTLQYFRLGLSITSAKEISSIIYKMTDFKAVTITDKKVILAHSYARGVKDHIGEEIKTNITKHAIDTGEVLIEQNSNEIDSVFKSGKLKSIIVVPLKLKNDVVGTLKLYKEKEYAISIVDEEVAKGLGKLFSTQLEISRVGKQEELRTKAELKALQAQINPHFLFNAINTIVSMIRTTPTEARELLIHLGDYFRKNLQITKDFIHIIDEVKHIEAYLKIEKARFGEKLNIIYDIADNLDYYIPPLLIQPLVENAVKHGVFPKSSKGTILITMEEENDILYIIVEDDGVGMNFEINDDSIGLMNVRKRLKAVYNEGSNLNIVTEENVGTSVIVEIPKLGGKYD